MDMSGGETAFVKVRDKDVAVIEARDDEGLDVSPPERSKIQGKQIIPSLWTKRVFLENATSPYRT